MHICGSTKACVILAMSVQRQMPVLRMKNFDETMTKLKLKSDFCIVPVQTDGEPE